MKKPIPNFEFNPHCDARLPQAALDFRKRNSLLNVDSLRMFNVTAWLYVEDGVQKCQVNPNIPISQLREQYGNAETEVGIHSECTAGEFFRTRPHLRVLQIFSERIPCPLMCGPLLRSYFPAVPWYYYYDRRRWFDSESRLLKSAADVLTTAYDLNR